MKRRFLAGLTAGLTALFLSGCQSSRLISGVDTLLRPPRLTDDQNGIYNALTSYLSEKELHLVYPQKGDDLSAFIRYDLDGDGGDEAIVFYQLSASSAASPVNMAFLDMRHGQWMVTSEFKLDGSGIEDVSFPEENGRTLAAIGLSYAGELGSSLLQVFSAEGGNLELLFSRSYQAKYVGDLTGNEDSELMLIYPQENSEGVQSMNAGLFSFDGEVFSLTAECAVNPDITRYQQVTSAPGASSGEASCSIVYLDGYRGNVMITEELLFRSEEEKITIRNMTWSEDGSADYPERYGLSSMDIDRDGRIEIPGQTLFPGYDVEDEEVLYQTTWYRHIGSVYIPIDTGYVGSQLGYMFLFPESWNGKVTAYRGSYNNEVTFSVYEKGVLPEDTAILSIRAVSAAGWGNGKARSKFPEYEYLTARGQVVFLARVIDSESEYALGIDEIRERFIDLG